MLTLNLGLSVIVMALGALTFLLCTAATVRSQDIKKLAYGAYWCGLLIALHTFAMNYGAVTSAVRSHF